MGAPLLDRERVMHGHISGRGQDVGHTNTHR
jgi:hypothetical protein